MSSTKMDWIVVKELGSGGYGVVELWKNVNTDEKLAIKRCKNNGILFTPKQKSRWKNEIEILKILNHDNIIATLPLPSEIEKEFPGDLPLLCMEYCSEGDLRMVLNKTVNCCGIEEQEAFNVIREISSAVKYLHQHKITHRDLKPENIVLSLVNNKTRYKLIDLGYAKELDESSQYASLVGSLNYVAPELFWKKSYSCSVDYWSLGILFYEVLTGQRPFLPNEDNSIIWIKHAANKPFDVIGADKIEDNEFKINRLEYLTDIREPANISRCIKPQWLEWFKLVFQWDPHLRGKHPNDPNRLVVFSSLEDILSIKIAEVIVSTVYKKMDYKIEKNTTVGMLREWIAKDCDIQQSQMVIMLEKRDMILHPTENIFELMDEQKMFFVVYCRGLPTTINTEIGKNVPKNIQRFFFNSTPISDSVSLRQFHKQCYREAIYLIKEELMLLKNHIVAICSRIDLIDEDIKFIREQAAKSKANDLIKQANEIIHPDDPKEIKDKFCEQVDTILRKIGQLEVVERIETSLENESAISTEMVKHISNMYNSDSSYRKILSKLLDRCIRAFENFKDLKSKSTEELKSILKDFFIQEFQFSRHCSSDDFILRIVQRENHLFNLKIALNSSAQLEIEYFKEVQMLKEEKDKAVLTLFQPIKEKSQPNTLNGDSDTLIYNNFLLQKKLDNLIHKMNKSVNAGKDL